MEQALKLMDEQADAVLDARSAPPLARWLGIRDRDGQAATAALRGTWQRHAEGVRAFFGARVAEVGTLPPWSTL